MCACFKTLVITSINVLFHWPTERSLSRAQIVVRVGKPSHFFFYQNVSRGPFSGLRVSPGVASVDKDC